MDSQPVTEATTVTQFFLTRARLRRECERSMAQTWKRVAVQLSSYHREINCSWMDRISDEASTPAEQGRLFVRRMSSFVTLGSFCRSLHQANCDRYADELETAMKKQSSSTRRSNVDNSVLLSVLLADEKNANLKDEVQRTLASSGGRNWYEIACVLSSRDWLHGVVTTTWIDQIDDGDAAPTKKAEMFLTRVGPLITAAEFVSACEETHLQRLADTIKTALPSTIVPPVAIASQGEKPTLRTILSDSTKKEILIDAVAPKWEEIAQRLRVLDVVSNVKALYKQEVQCAHFLRLIQDNVTIDQFCAACQADLVALIRDLTTSSDEPVAKRPSVLPLAMPPKMPEKMCREVLNNFALYMGVVGAVSRLQIDGVSGWKLLAQELERTHPRINADTINTIEAYNLNDPDRTKALLDTFCQLNGSTTEVLARCLDNLGLKAIATNVRNA